MKKSLKQKNKKSNDEIENSKISSKRWKELTRNHFENCTIFKSQLIFECLIEQLKGPWPGRKNKSSVGWRTSPHGPGRKTEWNVATGRSFEKNCFICRFRISKCWEWRTHFGTGKYKRHLSRYAQSRYEKGSFEKFSSLVVDSYHNTVNRWRLWSTVSNVE